jgi:signal transduction histidine kinase
MSTITLNKTDYRVATFCDVTESQKAAQAEANVRMVEFMTSSITHETITPLKCIVSFSQKLQKVLKHSDARRDAEYIYITAKLILSQVKMLLDRNMLKNDLFTLSNEDVPINRIVEDAVQIMKL